VIDLCRPWQWYFTVSNVLFIGHLHFLCLCMQAGLLAEAQTAHQDRLEPIQTQLTEELESWRAEQQSREDLLKERIATLESELTRLRGELDQARFERRRPNGSQHHNPLSVGQRCQRHSAQAIKTISEPATKATCRSLSPRLVTTNCHRASRTSPHC
jgi:hypothetical protein